MRETSCERDKEISRLRWWEKKLEMQEEKEIGRVVERKDTDRQK